MATRRKIILAADLSQVEGRVCYALTGDPEMVRLANAKPWETDMHILNAAIIFDIPYEQLAKDYKAGDKRAKEMRYLGKIAVHGAQRNMMGKKLSETLLKDGTVKSIEDCQWMIDQYHRHYPQIRRWMGEVRKVMLRDRVLINSWGRRLEFHYERLDDETVRRGLSFPMQSEAADLMQQCGLLPTYEFLVNSKLDAKLHQPVHDELVISCWPEDAYSIASFVAGSLEICRELPVTNRPPDITVPLVVPVTFKMGKTWKGTVEFDRLPDSWEPFTDAAMRAAE